MRVALFEILHREDIPVAVAIDEAVSIAGTLLRRRGARLRQRRPLRRSPASHARSGGLRRGRRRPASSRLPTPRPTGSTRSPTELTEPRRPTTRQPSSSPGGGPDRGRRRRRPPPRRPRRRRARRRGPPEPDVGRTTPRTCGELVDAYLGRAFSFSPRAQTAGLDEAMRYSLLAGGKRIRPGPLPRDRPRARARPRERCCRPPPRSS